MATTAKCGTCGAPLPEGAPSGQCPECLLQLGLSAASNAEEDWLTESPQPVLRFIGDYELLEEIARGGMGVVYKALQVKLNRIVAVKMILAGHFAGKESVHRFRSEAEAAASLRHPNIVAIHEIGVHEGQQYFSMDYIEGRNLAEVVRDNPMSPKRAAECAQTIAEAIQYAHERGILHRDLKPSNVILDIFEAPHITDFGLAKRLTSDSQLTLSGQVLGSPNYIAPEQASGKRGQVSPASDVYSVGAILHHLLTGRAPFGAESVTDTLDQVLHAEPVSLRLLNPTVPVDLETICLKCLEKEPSRRYQAARDLEEELGRFLRNEPILARPIGLAEKTWRWSQRQPVLATLAALALLLFLVVAIGAPIAVTRTNRARLEAEQNLYAADMREASRAVHEGAFNHARELLARHVPRPGADDLRGFEWRYLEKTVQESEPIRTLDGLPAPSGYEVTTLFRSERFLFNESTNQLRAWDMTSWTPLPMVPPPQAASVNWQWDLPQGSAYAVDETQHTLKVYSLPTFQSGTTLHLPGPVSKITMSDDHQVLAVAFYDGAFHRVLVWDLELDTPIGTVGSFDLPNMAMVFSHDRSLLATGSTNGVTGIWDLQTLRELPTPPKTPCHFERLTFSLDNKRLLFGQFPNLKVWSISERQSFPLEALGRVSVYGWHLPSNGRYFAISWDNYDLTLYDARTLVMKGTMHGHRGAIAGIAFSPDGKLMASASQDQTARVWDIDTQTELGVLGGFGERICGVEFSPDGQNIVLLSGFGQIKIYRLDSALHRGLFAKIPLLREPEGIIHLAVSPDPDERRLATISAFGGTLALWDRHSGRLIRSNAFPRYTEKSHPRVSFFPDGKRVAWVTGDALHIMQIESGEIETKAIDGNREANAIAFSPDGNELAFASGKQLMICELNSGRHKPFAFPHDEVFAIGYSPDGRLIAFGDRQGTVTLCQRAGGKVLSEIKNAHPPLVSGLAWSPDGRLLATSGADASIKLWHVLPDGLEEPPTPLLGHIGYVNQLAFSPDGARLVSSSGDQTLKIWDPQRGQELATFYGHHDMVTTLAFMKDGCTFYSSSLDGEIRFWEAPPLARLEKK